MHCIFWIQFCPHIVCYLWVCFPRSAVYVSISHISCLLLSDDPLFYLRLRHKKLGCKACAVGLFVVDHTVIVPIGGQSNVGDPLMSVFVYLHFWAGLFQQRGICSSFFLMAVVGVGRGSVKTLTVSILGAEFGKVTGKSCLSVRRFSLSSPAFRVVPELLPQLFLRSEGFWFSSSSLLVWWRNELTQLFGCVDRPGCWGRGGTWSSDYSLYRISNHPLVFSPSLPPSRVGGDIPHPPSQNLPRMSNSYELVPMGVLQSPHPCN